MCDLQRLLTTCKRAADSANSTCALPTANKANTWNMRILTSVYEHWHFRLTSTCNCLATFDFLRNTGSKTIFDYPYPSAEAARTNAHAHMLTTRRLMICIKMSMLIVMIWTLGNENIFDNEMYATHTCASHEITSSEFDEVCKVHMLNHLYDCASSCIKEDLARHAWQPQMIEMHVDTTSSSSSSTAIASSYNLS